MIDSEIKELITQIANKPYIENVKELLHELNFEFMDTDYWNFPIFPWQHPSHKKYQWMVRRYRQNKSILFDFRLMVGIRFLDYRSPKIILYAAKAGYLDEIRKPWKVPVEVNAKKKKIPLTFPDEMSIQDRIDWRKMHKKHSSGKSLSKNEKDYYFKFKPLIGNLDKEFDHL